LKRFSIEKFFYCGMIVIGTGFFLLSISLYGEKKEFLENATFYVGEVVDYVREIKPDSYPPTYAPKVMLTVNGETRFFISKLYQSGMPYKIGQSVGVLCDNNEECEINEFEQLWMGVILSIVIGFVFFITGIIKFIIVYISENNKRKDL
jgi:hypothetical protein